MYAVGVEMCYPFQTLYLNQRLGLSMTSVGLIIGVTLLAGLPFQIVGGAIADRFGRRPVLILAICAGMALFIGLGAGSSALARDRPVRLRGGVRLRRSTSRPATRW